MPSRYVALSGFRNLLALCFSGRLPALFHAGNAFGVHPFRVFPPPTSRVGLSTLPCPPVVRQLACRDFRALIRWRIRCLGRHFQTAPKLDTLLGFHPLQGLTSFAPEPLRVPPLMDFSAAGSLSRLHGPSESCSRRHWQTFPSLPTLLGFFATLST